MAQKKSCQKEYTEESSVWSHTKKNLTLDACFGTFHKNPIKWEHASLYLLSLLPDLNFICACSSVFRDQKVTLVFRVSLVLQAYEGKRERG